MELTQANAVVMVILSIITTFGNFLVIYTMHRDPLKELRTIPNWLITNLAFSDLMLGLVVEPLWAVFHWVRGVYLYQVIAVVMHTAIAANFYTLTALSLERYTMLKTRGLTRSAFQHYRLVTSLAFIWFLSVGMAVLILIKPANVCTRTILPYMVGLPSTLILVILYMKIFIVIRNVYHKDFDQSLPSGDLPKMSINVSKMAARCVRKKELQIAKTIFTLLAVLVLLWSPTITAVTITSYCPKCKIDSATLNFMITVGFMNAAINPLIYAFQSQPFRNAVYFMLKGSA
ncbi:predicted protein [Nematostella vectensis]|uniref:G-protein coupled receptors family 1 profile domain-containing protein n=1 Tax=Nematostella vectensis TaxID=45351 RepID=A7SGT8_NEMVE|nr:predicted protein [Nematostella vectensis]|eukprot:XP_001629129.1 predicted protein [Nematostella vectensis]